MCASATFKKEPESEPKGLRVGVASIEDNNGFRVIERWEEEAGIRGRLEAGMAVLDDDGAESRSIE